jgi:hypothetical protein
MTHTIDGLNKVLEAAERELDTLRSLDDSIVDQLNLQAAIDQVYKLKSLLEGLE